MMRPVSERTAGFCCYFLCTDKFKLRQHLPRTGGKEIQVNGGTMVMMIDTLHNSYSFFLLQILCINVHILYPYIHRRSIWKESDL